MPVPPFVLGVSVAGPWATTNEKLGGQIACERPDNNFFCGTDIMKTTVEDFKLIEN